jgi:hypothetical protein
MSVTRWRETEQRGSPLQAKEITNRPSGLSEGQNKGRRLDPLNAKRCSVYNGHL